MSTIPELLKEAYTKKDWMLISLVYKNLTGQILDDTQDFIYQPQTKIQANELNLPRIKDGKGVEARTEQFNPRQPRMPIPMFEDDLTEAIEDTLPVLKKIDPELYKKLTANKPRPKVDNGSNLVRHPCCKCGQLNEIAPDFKRKNYTCDKCLNGKQIQY